MKGHQNCKFLEIIFNIIADLYNWFHVSDNRLQLHRIIISVMSTQRQANFLLYFSTILCSVRKITDTQEKFCKWYAR